MGVAGAGAPVGVLGVGDLPGVGKCLSHVARAVRFLGNGTDTRFRRA